METREETTVEGEPQVVDQPEGFNFNLPPGHARNRAEGARRNLTFNANKDAWCDAEGNPKISRTGLGLS